MPAGAAVEREWQDRSAGAGGTDSAGVMSPAGRVTNLFLPEPEVRRLLDAGEMEALEFAGGLALARTVGDFRRLYYAAESVAALGGLRLPAGEFVTDVVGRESETAPAVAALSGAGCRRFLLWVQSDNARAIAQYERAGYRPDGLIDRILRKSD